MNKVSQGQVASVKISGGDTGYEIEGEYKAPVDGKQSLRTYALPDDKLISTLQAANVQITVRKPKDSPYLLTIISWAPMILIIGIWIFFMRQMQTGGNKALSF